MQSSFEVIEQACILAQEGRRNEAIALLRTSSDTLGHPPEIEVELGLQLCFVQREDEALECLRNAWPNECCEPLAKVLTQYGFARIDRAQRLGVDDAPGKAFWNRIQPFASPNQSFSSTKLSAVLIVRNEEGNLSRCLESIKGKVDEIVVVDTGSNDATVSIANSYGATIGYFEWCDDFSAARNASLDLATGDWALWIDADEEVDPSSWPSIWEAVIRHQFGGYFVPIVNYTDEAERNEYTHAPIRLFQLKTGIRFENKIHEQISPSLDRLGLATATLDRARIWHYGYKPSEMDAKQKIVRTIAMLEAQVEESPNDAFHWFNLANAYSVAKRYAESATAARTCLRFLDPGNNYGSLTFQLLQGALNATERADEALTAALECKQAGFFTILNQFELAHSFFLLRRFDDALTAIEACMAMPWHVDMTGDRGIVTHKSLTLKGQILLGLDRPAEALECFDESFFVDPEFGLTILGKAMVFDRTGKYTEAIQWYSDAVKHPSVAFESLKGLARAYNKLGDFENSLKFAASANSADPNDREAWSLMTLAFEGMGNITQQIECYADFTERHGAHADVLTNWGRALADTGELESAALKFNSAIEADPGCSNAWLNLADLFYSCGLYQDAITAYDAALRIDPVNANAWFCLGNAAGQLGAWEAAMAAYSQTLRLQPGHEPASHNLGIAEDEFRLAG